MLCIRLLVLVLLAALVSLRAQNTYGTATVDIARADGGPSAVLTATPASLNLS